MLQQHRDCPVSAAGALIVDPFKRKITVGAIAYEEVTRSTSPASTPIGCFLFGLHFFRDVPSFTPSLIAF